MIPELESRGEGQEGLVTSGFDPAAKLAARVVLDEDEVINARGLPDWFRVVALGKTGGGGGANDPKKVDSARVGLDMFPKVLSGLFVMFCLAASCPNGLSLDGAAATPVEAETVPSGPWPSIVGGSERVMVLWRVFLIDGALGEMRRSSSVGSCFGSGLCPSGFLF